MSNDVGHGTQNIINNHIGQAQVWFLLQDQEIGSRLRGAVKPVSEPLRKHTRLIVLTEETPLDWGGAGTSRSVLSGPEWMSSERDRTRKTMRQDSSSGLV